MLTEKTSTILGKFCLKDESLTCLCCPQRGFSPGQVAVWHACPAQRHEGVGTWLHLLA